jgi:hypothetical protein
VRQLAYVGTDLDDHARGFVTKDHRLAHDKPVDAAPGVVVLVAAANVDGLQRDPHVAAAERFLQRGVAQRKASLSSRTRAPAFFLLPLSVYPCTYPIHRER